MMPAHTRLLPRDLDSLVAIARFRMLTRAQLHRWKFPGLSDTVVRRFIQRMTARRWLGMERLNKNGVQVVWCTAAGRDVLVAEGVATADELFAARTAVPLKDRPHTAAIIDAAIRLVELGRAGDRMLPAWTLQRLLGGRAEVVPDLLCLRRQRDADPGAVLAVEVDLATEPIGSCVVPKAGKLVQFLVPYSGSPTAILVLTAGDARRRAVAAALDAVPLALPLAVEDLHRFCDGVRSGRSVEGTV